MTRLLIVEDDRNLGDGLAQYLAGQGFAVTLARSLAEARAQLAPANAAAASAIAGPPELIVLDWMLPDGQGLDLLAALRAAGDRTPVVFLTARGDLVDRVVGLEAGAADYVVKPFEPRELVARIRAQLRAGAASAGAPRSGAPAAPIVEVATLRLDPAACTVHSAGSPVALSPKEFLLLKLLMENPNRVFSREEILNRVWGYDRAPTTRTVDTHVLQLRQKFPDLLLETVRGLGYRLKVPLILLALLVASLLGSTPATAAPPDWLADSPAPAAVRAAHAAFVTGDSARALADARDALAAHPLDRALRDNLLALIDRVLEATPEAIVDWSFPAGFRSLTLGVDRTHAPDRPDQRRLKVLVGLATASRVPAPALTSLRVLRIPTHRLLDPFASRGAAGPYVSPTYGTFHWATRRLEDDEPVVGLHRFEATLSSGASLTAWLPLARLDSSATPLVRSPRPGETLFTQNPTIHFDDFRSPEWRPAETRELLATIQRDDELAFVDPDRGDDIWSFYLEHPAITRLTIGPQPGVEPGSLPALPPGRYVLQLTYREQRPYGPATLSRDSTTRIPFRIGTSK